MVSEKTDGMRYFLMVQPNGQGVLVDRRMCTFVASGLQELVDVARLPPGTILDGEVVQNR